MDVKEILEQMGSYTQKDAKLIESAYEFAKKAHSQHTRDSGEPFFIHPFETAKYLAHIGMDAEAVSAGLLHDTIEDTDTDPKEMEKLFGKEVLFLVGGVTKLGKLKYTGTTRHNESLRKLFVAISQDIRVLIIKLADRLHNMQTLHSTTKEKQERMARETLEIYAPLAHRLGIRKIYRELEDLGFMYSEPKAYNETKNLLKNKSRENIRRLDKFHKSVVKALTKEGVSEVKTNFRIKNIYSLYRKLLKKGDIEKIYDISALRVIVPSVSECYKVLGILHAHWRPLPNRIRDYIAFPKPDGYRSIHTTLFTGDGSIVEVQVKTKEMNDDAEYGTHISYKENGQRRTATKNLQWIKTLLPTSDSEIKNKTVNFDFGNDDIPRWIKELAIYQSSAKDKREFITNLKSDFFQERIFVFTPKGDVVDLPTDSCPIDFAYSIHSDIGNKISGAMVNKKFVSLDFKLRNGDIVEIMTKENGKPSRRWLGFVKTTAAKKHIKISLDDFEKKEMRRNRIRN